MEKTLPYQAYRDRRLTNAYEAVCARSVPIPADYTVLFPETIPILAAEELARLRMTLTLEADTTGSSPSLLLRFLGLDFSLSLTGMARLSATYWLNTDTSELVPISGGGVPPGSSTWQLIPAVSTGALLPTSGSVPLLIEAQWEDISLHSAAFTARLAPAP